MTSGADDTQRPDATGGGETKDYGGIDKQLEQVDLESANSIASDPPGGLGTDIGGGTHELGTSEQTGGGINGDQQ